MRVLWYAVEYKTNDGELHKFTFSYTFTNQVARPENYLAARESASRRFQRAFAEHLVASGRLFGTTIGLRTYWEADQPDPVSPPVEDDHDISCNCDRCMWLRQDMPELFEEEDGE